MSCNGPTTRGKNSRPAPPDDRSSKRQKRTDDQPSTSGATSKYFAVTTKRPIEDVEDDSPGASTPQIHDLTRDGSQPDTTDVLSVASTKNTSTGVDITEYRQVQVRNSMKKPRQRRSRAGRRPTPSPADFDDTHAVQHRNLPPQHRHSSANIDDLDVWSEDNPPPSNVVSDVVPQLKRQRAGNYAPPSTKRFKTDDFTDELSEPSRRNDLPAGKKPNNFSSLMSQSPNRPRHRGDIARTTFQPVRPVSQGRDVMAKKPAYPPLAIVGAAGGRYTFYAEKPEQQVKLHLGENIAKVIDEGKGTIEHAPWLEIRRSSVKSIEHAVTNSCFIHINRSVIGEGPSHLALEFASKDHALYLHNWLFRCAQEESSDHGLGLKFKHAFDRAKEYAARSHKQTTIRSPAAARLAAVMEQTTAKSNEYSEIKDPFKGEPITQRPPKLKDQMKGVPEPVKDTKMGEQELEEIPAVTRSQRPETRRTRRSSPVPLIRDKTPDRWSAQNPGWDKDWHRSLVYPPTGKNRATVDRDDIPRLDEGEFLNDNLISFYLRYLQVQLEKERPEVLDKVYIFNTFFFEKLRSNRAKINYDGVKAWTARIDLLSYDYIVVPVNENAHWYLAIIYNAPRLLPQPEKKTPSSEREAIIVEDNDTTRSPKLSPVERTLATISLDEEVSKPDSSQAANGISDTASDVVPVKNTETPSKIGKRKSSGGTQKFSIEDPRIITLDSLGAAHSPTCKCLRDYLVEEAKHKKGVEITTPPGGMTARNIPEQDNYCDCGVFVLGYMEHFLQDPDEAVRRLLQKEKTNWNIRPSQIRKKVRNLLFTLQKEQHERLEKERQLKKQLKAAKAGLSSSQAVPSSPQAPPKSPATPRVNHEVKSPVPNGVKTPAANESKKTNEISAYFQVMPSEEPIQPQTPRRGEPELAQPPEDDCVTDVKTSSSNEVFHSAPCSPINSASKLPVQPADGVRSPIDQKAAAKQTSSSFVHQLTGSPAQPPGTSSTMRRNSSPEVIPVSSDAPSAKSVSRVHVIDLEPTIMASIEDDRPSSGGPQYDGVDRSIDLTG
ncbi:hypothetical protein N0V84_010779 [Fusarium piperis]|uniref:Ubiquitin-like protease family profile domain-containing protein n=1 Tax=Fusarium piperis TaxID=1435070 RepID=A0A9W8TBM0_9HYPO|nr:hypothetical protein N0V84_010779 [Fusarium piperis]